MQVPQGSEAGFHQILKLSGENTAGVYDKRYGAQLETLLDLYSQNPSR